MARGTRTSSKTPLRRAAIAKLVVDQYLQSGDFNGLAVRLLKKSSTLKKDVCALIEARALDMVRGDGHPNPHIKAMPVETVDVQLAKIASEGLGEGCLYPTPEALASLVKDDDYADRPFSRELALGAASLDFRAFGLVALEYYRNDPRFRYRVDDVYGSIVYDDKYFDETSPSQDRLVMDRFGFCHSQPDLKRAVAVFLWDLHKLEPEQQQHWSRHLLKGEFILHPDFYRSSILGDFGRGVSIFDAFLEEKNQINIISGLMGRAPLFRTASKADERPDSFGFLIRPTQKELRSFTLLLDQLLSDDLNADFFHDIDRVVRGTSEDGKPMAQSKGTIQLLQEWLDRSVRFPDPGPKNAMLKTFRNVRQLRQKPAHKVDKDAFDEKFFEEQRTLIINAYGAVRDLRLILQNHPAARTHRVPEWLQEGKFWTR
jgi:hypothetical protein